MAEEFDSAALRTLVTGADLGNFSRAATRLNKSQSAVSMQLRKLERQAGTRLFCKEGRRLTLTPAGENLLAFARRILALHGEAAASLGALKKSVTVRVGMPQDFAGSVLSATLLKFAEAWPEVHVEAQAGRNYSLAEDVLEGRLDRSGQLLHGSQYERARTADGQPGNAGHRGLHSISFFGRRSGPDRAGAGRGCDAGTPARGRSIFLMQSLTDDEDRPTSLIVQARHKGAGKPIICSFSAGF